jgi:hypothetical protein
MTSWNRLLDVINSAGEPTDLPTAVHRIAEQQDEITKLREVLTEVQQWIKNWDPSFIHDDEWPATAQKIEEALKQGA